MSAETAIGLDHLVFFFFARHPSTRRNPVERGAELLHQLRTTLFAAILALVASAVVLQLWLLTVSLEALRSGEYKTLVPAAVGSTVLLAINAGLLRYVFRFDRDTHGE
ncbi:MAG: DUF6755 family protein [Candidatus Korobacteraceae bacterium]